ncbi:PQQ-dependent sugar dehydrogenase [Halpernia frigidisoli]|uniref:Por secretion system C-terminal sorting domain-containing protein n=1 Tax=Halpernia frigidisoli TaxID=1125876 RepID=A0A1I3E123_9FLAO|nr:PQQ-dependent sugar dehydrogenase [Halpernia frigidisoli]SFH92694.1 Por secretion system C-terminal sorting domain-containing protein [Halpernia frigidisoli]
MKKLLLFMGSISSMLIFSQNIVLQEFATGFANPVEITNAKDNRLFVVQQNGEIKIVQPSGSVNPADFINLNSKITFGGERGLLGLAFHPQFATNGYFFVYYNAVTTGNITVARYSVNATNQNTADLSSEKILLNIPKPFDNHNGGSLHFDPDGMLWISTGDGGSGGDPNNNAQNKNSLLGKILRIDVNSTAAYNIPTNNPFVAGGGAPEIWSYGLRNSWKYSFDLTSGNVMIADVGQNLIEEIDRMPISQAGINYGWRCYEGNADYNTAACANKSTMTFPIVTYDHSGGKCSITGGYVYRGTNYSALTGKYIFADYCSTQLGILNSDNSINFSAAFTGNNFATFGEDNNKELYVAAVNNGKVFKVTTSTLSTNDNTFNKTKISPNPASGNVFVKGLMTKNNSVEIINTEGRKILENDLNENGKVDISNLKSGIYFITIKSDGQKIYSQKLIVK